MVNDKIDSDNKSTSEIFILARNRRGFSQRKFAKMLGISNSYLSKIESGEKEPSETLKMLFDKIERERKKELPNQKNSAAITATNCRDVIAKNIVSQNGGNAAMTMEVSERERKILLGLREYFSPAEIRALETKIEQRQLESEL